jgi:hypothetical protein
VKNVFPEKTLMKEKNASSATKNETGFPVVSIIERHNTENQIHHIL